MSLTQEERDAVVAYRTEKAQRTLQQAIGNYKMGYVETTANRLYYAAYYAASALLIKHGLTAHTHNGVKAMLGQNFIKTGILSPDMGKLYNRLFNCRLTGDYEDNYELDMDYIKPLIEPTKQFVSAIENLIKGSGVEP